MGLLDFRVLRAQPPCSNHIQCRGIETLVATVAPIAIVFVELMLVVILHDRILNTNYSATSTPHREQVAISVTYRTKEFGLYHSSSLDSSYSGMCTSSNMTVERVLVIEAFYT